MSARPITHPITRCRARSRAIAGLLGVAALVLGLPAAPGATRAALSHPEIQVGGFPTGIALDPATDTHLRRKRHHRHALADRRQELQRRQRAWLQPARDRGHRGHRPDRDRRRPQRATRSTSRTPPARSRSSTPGTATPRTPPAATSSRRPFASGSNPQFLAVDEKTHTIYVANSVSNTVSVIDGRHCNATRDGAAATTCEPRSRSGRRRSRVAVTDGTRLRRPISARRPSR